MSSGWKGAMGDFLNLDWIPRYLLVNTEGEIVVYKAVKLNDKNLLKNLKWEKKLLQETGKWIKTIKNLKI